MQKRFRLTLDFECDIKEVQGFDDDSSFEELGEIVWQHPRSARDVILSHVIGKFFEDELLLLVVLGEPECLIEEVLLESATYLSPENERRVKEYFQQVGDFDAYEEIIVNDPVTVRMASGRFEEITE